MSSMIPLVYPLDLTGRSPDNLVVAEPHVLGSPGNRAFVPNYGPFYAKTLVVRDRTSGLTLVRNQQFKAIQMLPKITGQSGQLVCSVVYITDPSVSNDVEITYQVVGGDFSLSVSAIQQMIDALNLDERPVRWGQIVGKPDFFPPAAHLHDLGDVYGFEFIVAALYAVREAILIGDAAAHQEIIAYINAALGPINQAITALQNQMASHLADFDNPHQVTKAQVQLGSVENYGIATQQEAQDGTVNNKYMTPLRVAQAVQFLVGGSLAAHLSDFNNPHQVDKTDVGLSAVQNFGIATTPEAQAGTSTTKYMTPTLVSAAITTLALGPLNAHTSDLNNPHQTSKAQVQLGSVENYPIASTTEANTGTATNRYMTPALVRSAVTTMTAPLTAHVNDLNNPHQTNKTQVGLGNVSDYAVIQSYAEALDGNIGYRYMTPQGVRWAIDAVVANNYNAHAANLNNPHQVNKFHVQLGNVPNFTIADAAQARDPNNNSVFITPWSLAQAMAVAGGARTGSHQSRGVTTGTISGTNSTNYTSILHVHLTSQVSNGYDARVAIDGGELYEAHEYNRSYSKSTLMTVHVPAGSSWYVRPNNGGGTSTRIAVNEYVQTP